VDRQVEYAGKGVRGKKKIKDVGNRLACSCRGLRVAGKKRRGTRDERTRGRGRDGK